MYQKHMIENCCLGLVGWLVEFESTTTWATIECSNQLSYQTIWRRGEDSNLRTPNGVNTLAGCRIQPALPPLQIDALSFRDLWPFGIKPSSFPSKSENYRSLTVVSTLSKIMSSISWNIEKPPYLILQDAKKIICRTWTRYSQINKFDALPMS